MTITLDENETTGMTELDYSLFDAPYGRDADGKPIAPYGTSVKDGITPLKKRGRKSEGVTAPPRARSARPAKGAKSYSDGIKGLLGIPAAIAGAMAQGLEESNPESSTAFKADEAAIYFASDGIANSLDQWAQTDPRVAAMLDKIVGGAPAATFAISTVFLGVQLAANHKVLKPMKSLGVLPAADLVAAYDKAGQQNAA
jgi:hypothetical protein